MKLLKISLLSVSMLIAMPANANPFAWFKAHSSAEDLKEIAEAVKRDTQLQNLYRINNDADNLAKLYEINCGQLTIDEVAFGQKEKLLGLERDRMKIDFAFITAQARWKLTKAIYFPSNFTNFKKEVLAPALKKAEKEAKAPAKPVSPSWYQQLKKAEGKLSQKERSKSTEDRKNEFKAWQTAYHAKKAAENKI